MNNKALKTLEYNKITDRLASHASSEPGIKLCRELQPMMDMDEINSALKQTSDAVSRIFRHGSISFAGLKDIRPLTKALEVGSALGMSELLDICSLLKVAAGARRYGVSEDEAADSLSGSFNVIYDIADVRREIERCILSEDEIADDASAELKNIRRQMRICTERIRTELNSMLNGSDRTYLQEAVITTRGGRYCIPVKAEYKSQVPGMVHDQSKAGSTFFIEPMSVVRLNNEIREYEVKESEEIAKILASLSAMAGNYTAELDADYDILSQLDFIFAKAKLSFEYKGSEPIMNTRGYINIRKGRHPLIDSRKVVPIDVSIGDEYSELIITGPNTGGKTVTLKTIGLFSLLGQSGLHIPAADNSELTVFNDIFADIGDEQSIEQSLSTFSSHMKNIIEILAKADSNSLVLFDELCAGTDPTEGAALAISILTSLHKLRVTTVATTHYSELKIFALSTEGVQNACCEFDVATLAPTYRLLIGIPGKSNAFAISGKLGLPQYIIDDAKESLASEDVAFEDVISDLEKSRVTIEREKLELEEYKKEVEDLKNQLKAKNERLDARSDNILQKAREEASAILREAKETADDAIRKLNKANAAGMSVTELEKQRQRIKDNINKVDKGRVLKAQAPARQHKASDFHIGDRVHVASLNLDGTVHTLPNQKGELNVTIGIMNYNVNMSDLTIIEEASEMRKLKQKSSGIGKLKMSKTASISPEINLIGMTSDEAIMTLDKYLDDAFLSHISPVRIVHGKGSGILRNAVHNYLKRQKHVKSFRLGSFGEGDYGVTIVEFKD
ncbi:MAG TPA: endonuclease MutS2 [Lachnospiraceae bacterium]|nr:mutS2 protein [Butyrivibrio sp. CAG:318]HJI32230.1 endonuclease MutS2 [Lachnospiraceae bacterium]